MLHGIGESGLSRNQHMINKKHFRGLMIMLSVILFYHPNIG